MVHASKQFSYIALLVMGLFSSCKNNPNSLSDINAKSIETYLDEYSFHNKPHLKIKHSAFSQGVSIDFLLYGAYIPMLNSPTGHTLKGRIVRFQLFSDRVIMLESPEGHVIDNTSNSSIFLAEFPVAEINRDGVIIDFARGMSNVFTMRNVSSRASSDDDSSTADQFKSITLSASFVKSIKVEDQVVTINQIAQWRNANSELISAEFRYFLREYATSADFQKTNFSKNRWVQYFSTPFMVQPPTTDSIAYIAKWNLSKPLVFYISHNTPWEYKEAIADGLLFWNHIFGKNIIEVKDLGQDISAPHPSLNIVQWVTWDNEASAYADMVVSPLTGEVLQAQIYVRSGWVIQSAKKLRNQLQEILFLIEPDLEAKSINEDLALPSMLHLDDPCLKHMGNFAEVIELAANISEQPITDEILTILTNDILRAVIAHEMGHVLGIRHNLAASTLGSITLAERDAALKNYLQSGQYKIDAKKFISRSIMDVFSAADDALVGAQIREILATDKVDNSRLATIFSFDKQAIEFGYFNKPMLGDVAFCTDEDTSKYLDCRRWDVSATPISFASSRLNGILNQVVIMLADTFILAIDPARKGGPIPLKDISLSNTGVMKLVDSYAKELLAWFSEKARSIQIESRFSAFGPQNEAAIRKARYQKMRQDIQSLGKERILFALLPPFQKSHVDVDHLTDNFIDHFSLRLKEMEKLHDNFFLAESDIDDARIIAHDFFTELHKTVVSQLMSIIARAQFDDKDYQFPIEEALGEIAYAIIFSIDEKSKHSLPQFIYDLKTRELAATLLNPTLGIWSDWSFDNLASIIFKLKEIIRQNIKTEENGNSVNLGSLSRDRRQWLMEQNLILNTLIRMRNLERTFKPPSREKPVAKPEDKDKSLLSFPEK